MYRITCTNVNDENDWLRGLVILHFSIDLYCCPSSVALPRKCVMFITGPPNGPVLFCSLASVTLPVGGPAGRAGGQHSTASQSCYISLYMLYIRESYAVLFVACHDFRLF